MALTIALAGNPNSGKTTLFNALTGSNRFVGNWPGVTIEKKEGRLKYNKEVIIADLPGIYSLSPYTLEEVISRSYLLEEKPDAVLNIVDGTNLERNLYLSTQLIELGIPLVIAVNMADILRKNGETLNLNELSKSLGVPTVEISALKGINVREAAELAIKEAENKKISPVHRFSKKAEAYIEQASAVIDGTVEESKKRFYSIKLLEGDDKIMSGMKNKFNADNIIRDFEAAFDDDGESIIINERYEYIDGIIGKCIKDKRKGQPSVSDKIDRIVTNRVLALPIFAAVMFVVYYVSVTTVGTYLTDWVNDGVFGEGFNLFGAEIPSVPAVIGAALKKINCAQWLSSLVLDGIVAGVGAVLGFVPQMLVLFVFLAFLEDCGYMARIAFIMDRIFRRFGLSGKSFIPMLIGTGCGVPGVMASRTIENERDRRMTIITTTFIPCGAKLPIIALIAGAFFGGASWVAPSAYFVGAAAIVVSGIILKKTKIFSGEPAPFVMELPDYHMPTLENVMRSMWERGWSFIKKAGTIILLSTILVWFASSFGITENGLGMVEDLSDGFLAYVGRAVAPVFAPLGFGDWKASVAAITGLVAKENVVGTFGILYGFAEVAEDGEEIWTSLAGSYTDAAAYSFLVFNLLCAPCFAAIGAIKREMNSPRWTAFAIGYQTIFAYAVSFCVYRIGTIITEGVLDIGAVIAFALILGVIYLIARPYNDTKTLTGGLEFEG